MKTKDTPKSINRLSESHKLDRRTLKKYLAGTVPARTRGTLCLYTDAQVKAAIEAARRRPTSLKQAAEIRLLEEKLRTLTFRNDVEAGKYVAIGDLQPKLRNVLLHFRAVLRRELESVMPARLRNPTEPEMREELRNAVDHILKILREGTSRWTAEVPPK